MAWVYSFNVATPAGGDDPREADDRMNEIKAATQERENVDHYWEASATNIYDAADTGKHRQITFREPISSPSAIDADEAMLYTKDVSGVAELHFMDEAENEVQITSGGAVLIADDAITFAKLGCEVDEDDMASDSAVLVPTQQSVKKYVDVEADAHIGVAGQYHAGSAAQTPPFNGASMTAANTWQNLDLSSIIGSNIALVFLEVKSGNASSTYVCKPTSWGSSTVQDHINSGNNTSGCSVGRFSQSGDYEYLVTMANASGVIQHASPSNSDTWTVKVVGYIR